MLASAGLRFSTGKIDHDILILLVPFFFRNSWGNCLALKQSKYRKEKLFPYLVSFYFLSSAFIKIQSGYLEGETQSVYQWLKFYEYNYGFSGIWGQSIVQLNHFYLEVLDLLAVLTEMLLAIMFFLRQTRILGIILAVCFHLLVFLIFGIDFSKLFFVYLLTLKYPFRLPKILKNENYLNVLLGATFALFFMYLIKLISGHFPIIYLFSLPLLFLSLAILRRASKHPIFDTHENYNHGFLTYLILLFPLLLTIFYTEPYPAIIGPGFRGDIIGCVEQTFTKNGVEISPESIFGVENPSAQNLGFYFFPNPLFQGHETRVWRTSIFDQQDFQVVWRKKNCDRN